MSSMYQVTIRGRRLESRDLRKLLARAVAEKRGIDQKLRLFGSLQREMLSSSTAAVSGSLRIEEVPIR